MRIIRKLRTKEEGLTRGFTLLELLVVITLISLISTIIATQFSEARMRTRDIRRLADLREIRTAVELYYSTYGYYPCESGNSASSMFLSDLINEGYLSKKPTDPINSGAFKYWYVGLPWVGANTCQTTPELAQTFELNLDFETPGRPCPWGGDKRSSTHCHIFFPGPGTNCVDPYAPDPDCEY